jgi:putative FmdB family regulatory protein
MPTYEYECKTCGHRFDAFQNIRDEPLKVCPECGKELRRLINGGSGVIFKGGGFYVTDKGGGRAATGGTASGAASAGKTDGKTGVDGNAKPASNESASKTALPGRERAETPAPKTEAGPKAAG